MSRPADRWYDAWEPMFSRDGKYLFFSSAQEFGYSYSSMEWNAAFQMRDKLFVLPLEAGTPNPMSVRADEYEPPVAEAGETKEQTDAAPVTKVDLEGIRDRIAALPVSAYGLVLSKDDKLWYSDGAKLKILDLKTLDTSDGPSGQYLALTPDASKALVRSGSDYKVTAFGSGRGRRHHGGPRSRMEADLRRELENHARRLLCREHARNGLEPCI